MIAVLFVAASAAALLPGCGAFIVAGATYGAPAAILTGLVLGGLLWLVSRAF